MNYLINRFPNVFPTAVSGISELFDEMDNMFSSPFTKKLFPYPVNMYNVVDKKTNKIISTIIEVALAGFDKSEICVKAVKGKYLTLTLTPNKDSQEETDNTFVRQVFRGIAKRRAEFTWEVSPNVDFSSFKPTFINGILKIVLPIVKEPEEEQEIIGNIE